MRCVELFSCSGGSGYGLAQAGFEVMGVDIDPQPRYAGHSFIQADVMKITPEWLRRNFDAAWASPPCQFASEVTPDKGRHLNLIPATRKLLEASGLPYVIENVRAARPHLRDPISLFGTMFDLHMVTSAGQKFVLSRERLFETNWPVDVPEDPGAGGFPIANVFGGHLRARSGEFRTGGSTGRTVDFPGEDRPALARQLMGMPFGTMRELSEAVPPAYARFLGSQLAGEVVRRAGRPLDRNRD